MKEFYISGVYFKENANIEKFLTYAKWLRKANKGNINKNALDYALFEILAEYKRCGVSKSDILKGMFAFSPCFVLKELIRRKKAAKKDIEKCMKVAEARGLKQTAGTSEYPIFENR